MSRLALRLLLVIVCFPGLAFGQGNGTLQIHHINVGQGDGAVIISPLGEVVMVDNGPNQCATPVAYLQNLGVNQIDYHIASHYHADHIGCTPEVLAAFPLTGPAYDRGGTFTTQTFQNYLTAVGAQRQTVIPGMAITLDASSGTPVTIRIVAANGNGTTSADENAKSIVAVVEFGEFEAVFGGDLTGTGPDIETSVAPAVGPVEVYKVHHHGSSTSSNANWLATTTPTVGVISVGATNSFGHPRKEVLDRLHAVGTRTYWTSAGNGAAPTPGVDVVGGHIVVQVAPGASSFAVAHATGTDTYPLSAGVPPPHQVTIDSPGAGNVGMSFAVSGWALDGRGAGTGIDTVHLWAHPTNGDPAVFLGVANYGLARGDVAAVFGDTRYAASGFALTVPRLGAGSYTLVAYARSTVTGAFEANSAVAITVASMPRFTLDIPAPDAPVYGGVVVLDGWALDLAAANGTGVDAVHAYAFPAGGGDPLFLGAAALGGNRPDVGAAFGSTRFNRSGWELGASLPPGQYQLAVYFRSTVTGAFALGVLRNARVPAPVVSIDSPGANATTPQPFTLSGWAVHPGALTGTGIRAVHVWAYPNPGSGAAPVFVGAASYGSSRPDVAAAFSRSNLANSGFSLGVTGLPSGTYLFAVHGLTNVPNSGTAVQTRTLTIPPTTRMAVDTPLSGQIVRSGFTVSGWALDSAAASGTGVDAVHIYATPAGQWAPQFLGAASYGGSRGDVGATFGARYTNSGYALNASGLGVGTWDVIVYARSTATQSFNNQTAVRIVNPGIVSSPAPSPPPTPTPTPSPSPGCCRVCTIGKACGDSCIQRTDTCRVGPGCACNSSGITSVPWVDYTPVPLPVDLSQDYTPVPQPVHAAEHDAGVGHVMSAKSELSLSKLALAAPVAHVRRLWAQLLEHRPERPIHLLAAAKTHVAPAIRMRQKLWFRRTEPRSLNS